MQKFRLLGCAYALAAFGCTGSIEGALGPGGSGGSFAEPTRPGSTPGETPSPSDGEEPSIPTKPGAPTTPGMSSAPLTCTKRSVGSAPFRHLTKVQYARTVQDVVGVAADVSAFPADDVTHGFDVGVNVSSLLVEAYADAAAATAARADLKKLVPCDPAVGDDACAKKFVDDFSRRLFRRATTESERAALLGVYAVGRTNGTFERGARLVVEAALQSPSFLYHVEQSEAADGDGLRKLSPYTLANRLSYLLWGSAPDVALLDAAAAGKLATAEGMESEARRLMSARPDAARRGFRDFYRQWLSLGELETMERDPVRYPEFNRALATALDESLSRQIDATVWDDKGDIAALLSGETAFVNGALAPLFGVSASGTTLSEVALDPTRRRGLLTHPALLSVLAKSNQSDPVIRGKFVRERLLCQPLPPPPPNVATVPPDPKPGLTTRQRFSEHSANPTCSGCHKLMDPIGFGLEHFDAIGRYRANEEGVAIDASGEIVSTASTNGAFQGPVELATKLGESREVRDCVATQYFRFALARTETNADGCALTQAFRELGERGGSIEELILAVVRSDAFRYTSQEGTP
jgi:hypothetical protein